MLVERLRTAAAHLRKLSGVPSCSACHKQKLCKNTCPSLLAAAEGRSLSGRCPKTRSNRFLFRTVERQAKGPGPKRVRQQQAVACASLMVPSVRMCVLFGVCPARCCERALSDVHKGHAIAWGCLNGALVYAHPPDHRGPCQKRRRRTAHCPPFVHPHHPIHKRATTNLFILL